MAFMSSGLTTAYGVEEAKKNLFAYSTGWPVGATFISIPTSEPTSQPSVPTSQPTNVPTSEPTGQPTGQPTTPTGQPTTIYPKGVVTYNISV